MRINAHHTETNPKPVLLQPGLLVLDMDSTLIQCECIDEIAGYVGIKPEVAELNDRARRGNMDFSESLIACLALLSGTDVAALAYVYEKCLVLTEGAEPLIRAMHDCGWKVGLVSGGFTYFTERLKQRLGLDFAHSNRLEVSGGKLTGRILGDIVDAAAKVDWLIARAAELGVPLAQTVAVGDGANDLPMLKKAGLGIAFHAKPAVRAEVTAVINDGGLDQVLRLIDQWNCRPGP